MKTNLAKQWRALARNLGLRDADALGAELLARWSEPHRAYHTTDHLAQVLAALDGADPRLALAAWFHDAIYDPARDDNETRSAALARERVRGLAEADVTFVADAVLATASHAPVRAEFAPLLDADLAVLAAEPAAYDAYRAGIRAEYAHIDDAMFRAGRLAFVRAMLARGTIFATEIARARHEARSRANLERERALLEGGSA